MKFQGIKPLVSYSELTAWVKSLLQVRDWTRQAPQVPCNLSSTDTLLTAELSATFWQSLFTDDSGETHYAYQEGQGLSFFFGFHLGFFKVFSLWKLRVNKRWRDNSVQIIVKALQGTHCTTRVTAVTTYLVLLWKAYWCTAVANSPPGSGNFPLRWNWSKPSFPW